MRVCVCSGGGIWSLAGNLVASFYGDTHLDFDFFFF